MAKFDHLKSREIAGKSVWLQIPQVSEGACLQVFPATDVNKAYQNAMLKRATNRIRGVAGRGVAQVNAEQSRQDDRELYPLHVITGWAGIFDVDGNVVEFSPQEAMEFCAQLPAWIFDRIRLFCMVAENFLGGTQAIDTKDLAGNSGGDSSGS